MRTPQIGFRAWRERHITGPINVMFERIDADLQDDLAVRSFDPAPASASVTDVPSPAPLHWRPARGFLHPRH